MKISKISLLFGTLLFARIAIANCDLDGFPGLEGSSVVLCDKGQFRNYTVSEVANLRRAADRLNPSMVPFLLKLNLARLEKLDPNQEFPIDSSTVNTDGYPIDVFGADMTSATAEMNSPGDLEMLSTAVEAYMQYILK